MKRLRAVLCLWLLAPAAAASAQALTPIPPLSGPVVDRAGLLSPSQRAELDTLARELQAKTGAQMAVLTVESTAPEEIFGYGLRVAEAWQLGSREKDDGLLLVLASRDRKLRFFTGYGLEGVLPDGKLGRILDRDAIPRLQRGEPGEAIVAAMQAAAGEIAADAGVELTGVAPRAPPAIDPLGPQFLLIGLLILCMFLAIRASGSRRRRRYRPVLWGGGLGGLGSGGFGGGYGGGGGFGGTGGFGGGGGGFGGGGAGRGW